MKGVKIPFVFVSKGDSLKNAMLIWTESVTDFIQAVKALGRYKEGSVFQVVVSESLKPLDYIYLGYFKFSGRKAHRLPSL